MTIDPSTGSPLKTQHDVGLQMCTWHLLEELTMPCSSPAVQQSLQDWEVCRVALSRHFALDILYMSMEW